jgi:signal peptide peptidase SppA
VPFEHHHSCRLRSPSLFKKGDKNWGQQERKSPEYNRVYIVIRGVLIKTDKWEDQAYRYPKDTWPVADARSHCRKHKGISFEPAKEEKKKGEAAEGFVLAGDLYAILLGELRGRIWAMEPQALQAFFAELHEFSGSQAQICTINVQAAQQKAKERQSKMTIADGVATIPVSGLLLKNVPWMLQLLGMEATSYTDIRANIADALADDSVKRIVLEINSPGGEVAGMQEAADAIFEARGKKPVNAFIDDLGASAAYLLASQANTINANANAKVGSIGLYTTIVDSSKQAEKEGIKVHVIRSGEHKGMGVPGAEITEAQITAIQQVIDDIAQNFVAQVARGRKQPIGKIATLATGQVWLAERAKGLGLIDSVGNFENSFAKGEMAMAEKDNAVDAEVLNEDAIRAEAALAERQRLAELKAAFSDEPAFAMEQFEKGSSLVEAKAAYAEVLKVKLAAEKKTNAELVEKAKAASGAPPVEFHESAQDGKDFVVLAHEKAKSEGISLSAAMSKLAAQNSELYKNSQRGGTRGVAVGK